MCCSMGGVRCSFFGWVAGSHFSLSSGCGSIAQLSNDPATTNTAVVVVAGREVKRFFLSLSLVVVLLGSWICKRCQC